MPTDLITVVSGDGAEVSVSLHGGHICSWRTADGFERLFLSPLTKWDGHTAIRGGIPVIFPQFGNRGSLQKHGFARTEQWTLVASEVGENGDGLLHLTLSDSTESRLQFPYHFKLDLHITFSGASLDTALLVTNTGQQAFSFTCALHTYLAAEVEQVAINGIGGLRRENSVPDSPLNVDADGILRINSEVDSIFFEAGAPVTLVTNNAMVTMQQNGFADAVVWNPWIEVSKSIPDLQDDAYKHFVCIESAAIEKPLTVAAGAQWDGHQQLTACAPSIMTSSEK
ncbi:D-hexose-6-phosphate mutarotase [Glaciimonas sp. Gout2]|uniref:D-hexose-6-phosphate mutarotase n=1 Tax=unclassified Glaciimonas TaxID=2644401 RepID=UPI002B22A0CB|nr:MULTISPECIES: D-hexose-6-phosphate mutarotase [unclassified Glaciimonas]MEB0010732.1 D-hexose-6-phosphate mutarotase [Glaciimonas sp. Cout2]MEB0082132.1 D-hexose-6-phosphate mutarotase [Glaciimonas sp. Gout2]